MRKQVIYIAAYISNGAVQRVENTVVMQPVIQFKGSEVKWYEDKVKVTR